MELGGYFDGRPLTYDESTGTFKVGDTPASADQVRDYAAVGQVVWASPEFATWFASTFPAPVVPAPAAAIPKPTGVTAVYTGYCRECGGRSQLREDFSCAEGHPRSQIREVKDAVTGLPYKTSPLAQPQTPPVEASVAAFAAPAGAMPASPQTAVPTPGSILGLLLSIPALFIFFLTLAGLAGALIGNPTPGPFIGLLIVAIGVGVDASRIVKPDRKVEGIVGSKPLVWGLGVLVGAIVFVPLYFYQRPRIIAAYSAGG
ncbi:MAG: hypothetical protein WCJ13_07980 [Coriobacteriia bacterium]